MYVIRGVRASHALLLVGLLYAGCGRGEAEPEPISPDELRAIAADLAFASERDGVRRPLRLRPGAPEARQIGEAAGVDEVPLAVAPDGGAVVVGRTVEAGGAKLEQLVVWEGGRATPLTPPTQRARNPSWSPDGTWLAFEADLASASDLWRVERGGAGLVRLTDNPEGNYEPTVAPDGESIVFVSSRDMNAEAYRMRADGTEPVRLPGSPRDEWAPRPSPDGTRLALLTGERGRDEIVLTRADGVDRQRPGSTRAGGPASGDVLEADPAWSPDGTRLAYATVARTGARQVWVAEIDTGAHRALTDTTSWAPAWSPDGRYLAFVSDRDGSPSLYLVRADGSGTVRLTDASGAETPPLWAARR